ncbi:MAG TPA: PP2C family protein-serine/threonine phosphatase [Saprospiraceae bacterium]|nr:PP2C family protein-serine/threonine phosphatase [Saprospiraceae bacterium]HNA63669.1 PP2C family protein-serine/threonine phosphatase [Saprospiraceae bacterium]HNM53112.1 PP2C family protein-serine/threonine phosphatase [Saprospiraceae bacterium]
MGIEATLTKMENMLSLKQLQMTSLLNITQAINENLPQEDIYKMYKDFLTWELSIDKIALFIKEDNRWKLFVRYNIDDDIREEDLARKFIIYERLHTIKPTDDALLQPFEFIIPVYHKKEPIAYSLISGIREGSDIYNNIQFITSLTNIIAVASENKRLVRRQITQEKELEFANEVTQMLIPNEMPRGNHYELANVYRPHFKVGGDYIDYIKFSDTKISFCIADVSGKGIAGAMIMANFQALIQNLGQQYRDLETLVIALNQTVSKITKGEKYLTLFIAVVDLENKMLYYVNAGHIPPLLFKNGKVTELKATCTIIGHFEELPGISEGMVELTQDCTLVAFTDGLVDIKNTEGINYTVEMLKEYVAGNLNLNARQLAQGIMKKAMEFSNGSEIPDDIAILNFKYNKSEK